MTMLEELYYDYSENSNESYEMYKNGDAKVISDEVDETLESLIPDRTMFVELSDRIGDAEAAFEKIGFICGFKYAMKMAAEIYVKGDM